MIITMIKNVLLLLLLGNLLNAGLKEALCEIYSPTFVQRDMLNKKTKLDLGKNYYVSLANYGQNNNKVSQLTSHKSMMLQFGGSYSSRRTKVTDGFTELAKPKLYDASKSVTVSFVQLLLKENTAAINKLKKLKDPSPETLDEAQRVTQNLKQLKHIQDKLSSFDGIKCHICIASANDSYKYPGGNNLNITTKEYKLLRNELPEIFEHQNDSVTRSDDHEDSYTECPTSCPAESQMVCAVCIDGLHRTFMGLCHLRMFNCKYPKEKLKLVCRRPCILSSPYHNSFEKIQDPPMELDNDDDPIMRHVWCVKYEKYDDPRCEDMGSLALGCAHWWSWWGGANNWGGGGGGGEGGGRGGDVNIMVVVDNYYYHGRI